ncbi:MAG: DUF1972 domain-containing protein, partial [Bdellovibrionales bacterium]|nr:DUF1972 domain-containing protein [Bdellovibrionales bacterium]
MSEKLRIALLGTRGIPARYGGFETFAEQLSTRLVKRGHEVTVYSRRSLFQSYSGPNEYHGVNIRVAPTVMHKYLETPLHALFSFIDLLWLRPDVVLLCNAANSPFAFLVRMQFIPLAINVDGIERNRAKWSIVGKAWYKLGEICSVIFGSVVVADAEVIARYYRDKFNIAPNVIAYGAEAETVEAGEVLAKFGLKPGEYILYVSRLEPENNALGVIQAYSLASTTLPLVIVGDAPYAHAYKEKLLDAARRS